MLFACMLSCCYLLQLQVIPALPEFAYLRCIQAICCGYGFVCLHIASGVCQCTFIALLLLCCTDVLKQCCCPVLREYFGADHGMGMFATMKGLADFAA